MDKKLAAKCLGLSDRLSGRSDLEIACAGECPGHHINIDGENVGWLHHTPARIIETCFQHNGQIVLMDVPLRDHPGYMQMLADARGIGI